MFCLNFATMQCCPVKKTVVARLVAAPKGDLFRHGHPSLVYGLSGSIQWG